MLHGLQYPLPLAVSSFSSIKVRDQCERHGETENKTVITKTFSQASAEFVGVPSRKAHKARYLYNTSEAAAYFSSSAIPFAFCSFHRNPDDPISLANKAR